ncbi:MAG: NADH:ubiquinone reductase (Na(+)-transporting) subunit C [Planctomycetes bacterium]|nr:NADH:ubiquinone reductase (Na(+)-transporting) subunit C [Planctomycetota bacterium]
MEFSNKYIFSFALLLCLICSLAVSFVHVSMRDMQVANAEADQKSQVLQVAGILEPGVKLTGEEIAAYFEEIDELVVSRETGAVIEDGDFAQDPRSVAKTPEGGVDAPEVHSKATGVRRLANELRAFNVRVEDHECLVLEIYGNGLWSTLLGYIALSPDTKEVRGITYYAHKETPGLGGEVDNPKWKAQWKGKRALDDDGEVLVEVVKGPAMDLEREIDGLSGATITSRGVDSMLKLWLGDDGYGPFLKAQRGAL